MSHIQKKTKPKQLSSSTCRNRFFKKKMNKTKNVDVFDYVARFNCVPPKKKKVAENRRESLAKGGFMSHIIYPPSV